MVLKSINYSELQLTNSSISGSEMIDCFSFFE